MPECWILACNLVLGYNEAKNMDTVRGTMVTLDIDPHISKKGKVSFNMPKTLLTSEKASQNLVYIPTKLLLRNERSGENIWDVE